MKFIKKGDSVAIRKQLLSIFFKISSVLLTFIFIKIYVLKLGTNNFGEYTLLHGYLLLLSTAVGSGFGVLALKINSLKKGFEMQSIATLVMSVAINILICLVVFFPINILYNIVPNEIIYSFITYSFSAFFFELIRSKSNGNIYILFKDMARSISMILAIYLFPNSSNVYLVSISSLFVLLLVLVYFLFLLYKFGTENGNSGNKFSFWSQYKSGLSVSLSSSAQILKVWIEVFLVGAFFNKSIVGLVSILQKLGQFIKLPLVALNADIAKSFVICISENNLSNALKAKIRISKYIGYLFSVLAVIILPIYLYFYEYELNFYNISLGLILIASNVVNIHFGPVGLFAQLSNLRDYYLRVTILIVFLSVILSLILINLLGIYSVILANLATALVWNSLIYRKIYSKFKFKF